MSNKIMQPSALLPAPDATEEKTKKKKMDSFVFGMEEKEDFTARGILLGTDRRTYDGKEDYEVYQTCRIGSNSGILAILAPLVVFLLVYLIASDDIDLARAPTPVRISWCVALLVYLSLWIGVVFKWPSFLLPFRAVCAIVRLPLMVLIFVSTLAIMLGSVAFVLGLLFLGVGYVVSTIVGLGLSLAHAPGTNDQPDFVYAGGMLMAESFLIIVVATGFIVISMLPFAISGFFAAAATKSVAYMEMKAEKKKAAASDVV